MLKSLSYGRRTISIVNDINHYDRTLELGSNYLDTDPFTFDNSLITPTLNKTINILPANLQILDEIYYRIHRRRYKFNTSNLTKRIKIIDTTPPVIELVGGTDVTVSESTSVYNWIEPVDQNGIQGWIAYDPRQDADDIILTPYVTREGNGEAGGYQVNLNDGDGNLEITYTVFDKQDQNNEWTEGNKFEITRNVNIIKIEDSDGPTIVFKFAPIKYDIGAQSAEQFIETGFTIFDDFSQPENITITIENFEIQQPSHLEQPSFGTLIGDFDGTQSLGLYKRVYTAIDESNNTVQAFRLIEYVDETPPTITLNTDIIINTILVRILNLNSLLKQVSKLIIIGNLKILQLLSKIFNYRTFSFQSTTIRTTCSSLADETLPLGSIKLFILLQMIVTIHRKNLD